MFWSCLFSFAVSLQKWFACAFLAYSRQWRNLKKYALFGSEKWWLYLPHLYQIKIPRVSLPFNHHYVIKWKLISKLAKDTYLVCVWYLVYKVVISVCWNVSSVIQKSLADLSQICWVWNSLEPRDCSLLGLTFFSCAAF